MELLTTAVKVWTLQHSERVVSPRHRVHESEATQCRELSACRTWVGRANQLTSTFASYDGISCGLQWGSSKVCARICYETGPDFACMRRLAGRLRTRSDPAVVIQLILISLCCLSLAPLPRRNERATPNAGLSQSGILFGSHVILRISSVGHRPTLTYQPTLNVFGACKAPHHLATVTVGSMHMTIQRSRA